MRHLALVAALLLAPTLVFAWGASGHRMISQIAAEHLPEEIPAFLRTPEAARQIGELGRELDRSKGSGRAHDAAWDPGHFIDLDDDGTILGTVSIAKLPDTRADYDTAIRAKGINMFRAGYLPYSIIEGWQQLVKDFAYWRADTWGEQSAPTPEQRAWFAEDRKLRELLTLRDLGVWSHYVGDASQPLHVSAHFNGWGPFGNPAGYSQSPRFHADFEGSFVRQHVDAAMVAKRVTPYADCACDIYVHTERLISASLAQVVPLYEAAKQGAFTTAPEQGTAFAADRLAFGASQLRDFIVDAWRASLDGSVGYPATKVRDALSGKQNPYFGMRAAD